MTTPLTRDAMAAKLRHESPMFYEYEAIAPEKAARYLDECMAAQERALREPWRHLTFDRTTEAHGRNGWFTLNDGSMFVFPESAGLRLNAKQHGKNSPIALDFTHPADMRLLGQALTQAAAAWEALTTTPCDVCKEQGVVLQDGQCAACLAALDAEATP